MYKILSKKLLYFDFIVYFLVSVSVVVFFLLLLQFSFNLFFHRFPFFIFRSETYLAMSVTYYPLMTCISLKERCIFLSFSVSKAFLALISVCHDLHFKFALACK